MKSMKKLFFCVSLLCYHVSALFHGHRKHLNKLKLFSTNSLSSSSLPALQLKPFLKTVLSSKRSNLESKKLLIQQLQGMRANESDASINRNEDKSKPAVWNGDKTVFLDAILNELKTVQRGWGLVNWPIPLPSYRYKLATLQRMIDIVLAEESKEDVESATLGMDESAKAAYLSIRKRRALSIIIGQLQSQPNGIWGLEKEARERKMNEYTIKEMLDRTPKGLETPSYTVVDKSQKTWEVREYSTFSVCSITMNPEQVKGPGGFNSLAGYIFGKNQQEEKMAMTTPVISMKSEKDTKMMFVMPSKLWSNLSDAPLPLDQSNVVVEKANDFQDVCMAVTWFGGYCRNREVDRRTQDFLSIINDSKVWKLDESKGNIPLIMQYNDPFQPPWRRRNEICFPVIRK